MSLVCVLSGQVPDEPVYSSTGYVFERRLIEKHISAKGTCPVTGENLTNEDLKTINVHKAVKPRPVAANSIPGLLGLFQNEWDSLMMETFQLRTHLDTVRNQLAQSLYQHDAACRVIARLVRERDAARSQISQLQGQLAQARVAVETEAEPGLSREAIDRILALAEKLKTSRKQRNLSNLTPVKDLKTFVCTGAYPIHQSTSPGITCCDVDTKVAKRIVTGGADSQVVVFDVKEKKTLCKMAGHLKRVNDVLFHNSNDIIISVAADKTARVWTAKEGDSGAGYSCSHVIRKHSAGVSSVSLHPLGTYFATCGRDKMWALHDIETGRCLLSFANLADDYNCLKFHPDGLILGGGGADGGVHIWDMEEQVVRAQLTGHTGVVKSLSFSENGYYLATAATDGTVKIWDLRKAVNFQTLSIDADKGINKVRFDHSGQYVIVASSNLSIHHFESRTSLETTINLNDHSAIVTDACFGENAAYAISTSLDRTVRIWEPPIGAADE